MKSYCSERPVDITVLSLKNASMQVTLRKDLEKFVDQKIRAGGYTNPSEVVRDALRDFRSKDHFAENDSHELAEMLLTAVRGKHRPLKAEHFSQPRARARRKSAQT
ncbi:MAG: ribbon-helix-helix domain-containing protein [Verrucomicrobiota bacterium]